MSGISQDLLDYIANFKFPYVNDVSSYEKLLKIGQGTFGYLCIFFAIFLNGNWFQ